MRTILAAVTAGLMLASCVPSTPQARIAQSPEMFAALDPSEQALVQQGQIATGMPPDAVYLAWGRPSGTLVGSKEGRAFERWDYGGTRPVYATGFGGTYGYAGGPYGRYGYSGFSVAPQIAYVPYRLASVWFLNKRVDSWERAR